MKVPSLLFCLISVSPLSRCESWGYQSYLCFDLYSRIFVPSILSTCIRAIMYPCVSLYPTTSETHFEPGIKRRRETNIPVLKLSPQREPRPSLTRILSYPVAVGSIGDEREERADGESEVRA